VVWADAKKVEDRQAAKKAKTKFLMYQHPAELESPTYAKLDVRQIVSRCQEGKYWEPGKTSQWRILASILAQGILASNNLYLLFDQRFLCRLHERL
jgi:hypothetical protein